MKRRITARRLLAWAVACMAAPLVLWWCLRDKLAGRRCRLAEWGDE